MTIGKSGRVSRVVVDRIALGVFFVVFVLSMSIYLHGVPNIDCGTNCVEPAPVETSTVTTIKSQDDPPGTKVENFPVPISTLNPTPAPLPPTKVTSESGTVTQQTVTVKAPDDSLLGRAFSTPGAPIIFGFLLSLLIAFLSAACAQRVLLGSYGITIAGVLTLADINEEAVSEVTIDLVSVKDVPEVETAESASNDSLIDPRLRILELRIFLEKDIRSISTKENLIGASILSVLLGLETEKPISRQLRRALARLLKIGDRIAGGAKIDEAAIGPLEHAYTLASAVVKSRGIKN
jgi:hypothetical protein